ncbi:MAG: helix-turn-helix transcriptional regulator [Alphaproteobacteria bacterium]
MIHLDLMMTPQEVAKFIAKSAREKRLALNLSQRSLSERSGVSVNVLKKFERTGAISILSLLKLALPLECLDDFKVLFKQSSPETFPTLDALLEQKTRKRGRK